MTVWLLGCPTCGDDREFAAPPCDDGHGVDCPDLACVVCGYAVVFATWSGSGDEHDARERGRDAHDLHAA